MNAHTSVPPRPSTAPFTGLPSHPAILRLRERDQWVAWDYVWKAERQKWDKPPLDPNTGGAGSSTDPRKWASYDVAAHTAARSGFAGVGFALAPDDDTTGIDLDKCRNAETGELDRWAAEIVGFGETYAEVSPSGAGIRLFAEGKIEATFKLDPAHVEVYAGGRYLTITGQHVPGTPTEIRPAPRTIEALRDRVDAIRAEIERKKAQNTGRSEPTRHPQPSASTFWRAVNDAAMASLAQWVPVLFGTAARYQPSTGAYRVSSRSLNRDLEEDLSITPGGIIDFGVADMGDPQDGKRTPIDLVREYRGLVVKDAAFWLCDRLGMKPDDVGWNERKSDQGARAERKPEDEQPKAKPSGPRVIFYGDQPPEPPHWLVRGLLPETQTAIVSGQWSAGKTSVCSDLAYCVMTGERFAEHEVVRSGGVLWLGAEGATEVDVRLKAVALHRSGEDKLGKLPFARQAFEVPTLTDPEAFPQLVEIVNEAKAGFATRFPGVDLVMIVVDTLASAAGFQDENSAAETQKVMGTLRRLSDASGALVVVVDHHGKAAETGVRGSSAKSGAADAILAALCDKDQEGEISNRRLAIVKLRAGVTGATFPFSLKPIAVDSWGNTSGAVEWTGTGHAEPRKEPKPAWSGNARVFKTAIETAMIESGERYRPFGSEGPEVKAVALEKVRTEFRSRYPAESTEAKQVAFKRFLKDALNRALIGSKERGGVDWIWFARDEDETAAPNTSHANKADTTADKPNTP